MYPDIVKLLHDYYHVAIWRYQQYIHDCHTDESSDYLLWVLITNAEQERDTTNIGYPVSKKENENAQSIQQLLFLMYTRVVGTWAIRSCMLQYQVLYLQYDTYAYACPIEMISPIP